MLSRSCRVIPLRLSASKSSGQPTTLTAACSVGVSRTSIDIAYIEGCRCPGLNAIPVLRNARAFRTTSSGVCPDHVSFGVLARIALISESGRIPSL